MALEALARKLWTLRHDAEKLRAFVGSSEELTTLWKNHPGQYRQLANLLGEGGSVLNHEDAFAAMLTQPQLPYEPMREDLVDPFELYIGALQHHDQVVADRKQNDEITEVRPGKRSTRDLAMWFHMKRDHRDPEHPVKLSNQKAFINSESSIESLLDMLQLVGRCALVLKLELTVDLHRTPAEGSSLASHTTLAKVHKRLVARYPKTRYYTLQDEFLALEMVNPKDVGVGDAYADATSAFERLGRPGLRGLLMSLRWTRLSREEAVTRGVDLIISSSHGPLTDPQDPSEVLFQARPPFGAVTAAARVERQHRGAAGQALVLFLSLDYAVVRWRLVLAPPEPNYVYHFTPHFELPQLLLQRSLNPRGEARNQHQSIDLRLELEPKSGYVVAVKGNSFASLASTSDTFVFGEGGMKPASLMQRPEFRTARERRLATAVYLEEQLTDMELFGGNWGLPVDFVHLGGEQQQVFAKNADRRSTDPFFLYRLTLSGPLTTSGNWDAVKNSLVLEADWLGERNAYADSAWKRRARPRYCVLKMPVWGTTEGNLLDYNFHVFFLKRELGYDSAPGPQRFRGIYLRNGVARDEIDWPRLQLYAGEA